MRCLLCHTNNIPIGAEVCLNPQCRANLRAMLAGTLAPGTLLRNGTLRIEYPLGRGGFGITYLATHLVYQQPVAVKEFFIKDVCFRDERTGMVGVAIQDREEFSTGLRKFLREGQLLARVNLPGVVQVRDLFQEQGTAFLVMEYLSGQTLKTHMLTLVREPDSNGRPSRGLPLPQVLRIMNALVESLSALHKQTPPICHLDIKPANIILEPDGRVVLIDFGASRQGVGTSRSNISVMAYTPTYAPPELQSLTPEFGPESDIYELGVVLHEILTGELPASMENRMLKQGWQPVLLEEPWKSKVVAALQLDRDRRPHDVGVWWHGQPPKVASKIPLAAVFAGISAVSAVLLGFLLLSPERKTKPISRVAQNNIAALPSRQISKPKTANLTEEVTICSPSGGLATVKCPITRTIAPGEVVNRSLCQEHALYCPECGEIWSATVNGKPRLQCSAPIHDNMSEREAAVILRLKSAAPYPQPKFKDVAPQVKLP